MLLWIPSPSGAPSHQHGHHHSNNNNNSHFDDNEKGDKLRRRAAEARFRNILMAVGLFILAFFATVSQVQYTQKRHHQPSLRIPGGNPNDPVEELTPEQQHQQQQAKKAELSNEGKLKENNDLSKDQPDDFFVPHSHLPENSIYRLTMTDVTGNKIDLSQFAGMVSLVVNTACHWGKTRLEMRELAVLNEDLSEEGFVVLAFPTNDFRQELESNEEVFNFWSNEFPEATFPIFELSSLADNPVYQRISQHLPGKHVNHNFFKYLVNREGVAVKMFTKKQDPLSLKDEIRELLNATDK